MAAFLRPLFSIAILMIASAAPFAQTTIDDFTMSGDTYRTVDDCFRLTEEEDYSSGSIWYKRPIRLSAPFAIELKIMAGCKDIEGADGMVFIFAPHPNRTGFRGEGIGFGGLRPSVAVEIDTWENEHLLDPEEDHLAFMVNGRVGHFSALSKPIFIPNIEDCKRHYFVVRWAPEAKRLSVEIDRQEVAAVQLDLIANIFGGNDVVYWGMSAATGRYNNYHEVCFDRLSWAPPLDALPPQPGKALQLYAHQNRRNSGELVLTKRITPPIQESH
jgi:hypothetical protein